MIGQPGVAYGPGDTSEIRPLLVRHLRGKLRAIPRQPAYCWGYIDDTSHGHVLPWTEDGSGRRTSLRVRPTCSSRRSRSPSESRESPHLAFGCLHGSSVSRRRLRLRATMGGGGSNVTWHECEGEARTRVCPAFLTGRASNNACSRMRLLGIAGPRRRPAERSRTSTCTGSSRRAQTEAARPNTGAS
jgi:hypothetical protein